MLSLRSVLRQPSDHMTFDFPNRIIDEQLCRTIEAKMSRPNVFKYLPVHQSVQMHAVKF